MSFESWTIYASPRDFPGWFVMRRWTSAGDGRLVPLTPAFVAQELSRLRELARQRGLVRIPRDPADDPCIIETWL